VLLKNTAAVVLAVIKSIETPNIDDRDGVPFQIFYGISGNDHNFWSIANARKVIGALLHSRTSLHSLPLIAPYRS
jgi:hypothetical protein